MKTGPVGGTAAFKSVAPHDTLEATALAPTLNMNQLTDLENGVQRQFLSNLELFRIVDTELTNMVEAIGTCFFEMACLGLVYPARLLGIKPKLDGIVAFALNGLHLEDRAGTSLNNGHRNSESQFVVNAGHPNFLTQYTYILWHNRTRCFN